MFSCSAPNGPMKPSLWLVESVIVSEQQSKKEKFLSLSKGGVSPHTDFIHTVWEMCIFHTQRLLSLAAFRFFCLPRSLPISTSCRAEMIPPIKCWWLVTHNQLHFWHSEQKQNPPAVYSPGCYSAADKPLASIHQAGLLVHSLMKNRGRVAAAVTAVSW